MYYSPNKSSQQQPPPINILQNSEKHSTKPRIQKRKITETSTQTINPLTSTQLNQQDHPNYSLLISELEQRKPPDPITKENTIQELNKTDKTMKLLITNDKEPKDIYSKIFKGLIDLTNLPIFTVPPDKFNYSVGRDIPNNPRSTA